MSIRLKNRPSDIVFVVRNDEGKSTSQIILPPLFSYIYIYIYIVYVSNLLIAIYTAKSAKGRKRREQVEAAEGILNVQRKHPLFYDTVGYNRRARNELIFNCMYSEMENALGSLVPLQSAPIKNLNTSLNQWRLKAWKSDHKNL